MTNNWSYKDIPISDYTVTHTFDPVSGEIELITEIAGRIEREIIQSKSDQIRNALIEMGWKPPGCEEYMNIQVTDGTDRKIEVLSVYFDDDDSSLLWVDIRIDGVKVGTDRLT